MKNPDRPLAAFGRWLQSPVLLFIRLAWGFQLAESGWGHLTHIEKTVQFFASLHIAHPLAAVCVSASVELLGGALLILGLCVRIIALPLLFNFAVAYATAGRNEIVELLHLRNPDDFINDSAFPFLVTALIMLAFGAGRISLDALLLRRSPGD